MVLWLAALLETHPLYKTVKMMARRDVKRHQSPLHLLLHTFKIKPAKYETLTPSSHPPNRNDSLLTHIAESREESREEDLLEDSEVCVYSEVSGLNGEAGAAAILFRGGRELGMAHYHLVPLSWHTTYEAEIVSVLLMLQFVREEDEADTLYQVG